MKFKLLILLAFFFFTNSNSQNVFTGSIDDKWSDENNWSGTVPGPSDNVIIPSGFVVTLDTPATILSIDLQGNSVFNVTQTLAISNTSQFGQNTIINWSGGDLDGGGVLTNSGTINMTFASFDITGSTTLNNPGEIILTGNGSISIGNNSVLNNSGTGTLEFQSNGVSVSANGTPPNVLNNYGMLKVNLPNPTDAASISGQMINSSGVIQVESGIFNVNTTATNFQGGTLHVFTGTSLNLNGPSTLLGTLTGNIQGDLSWNNSFTVDIGTTGILDFSLNENISWDQGNLQGGGTLINRSIIERNNAGNVFINGGTVLENEGTIVFNSTGDIFIATNSILNNTATGIIEFSGNQSAVSASGSPPHTFTNSGVIRSNQVNPGDQANITAPLLNTGTLQIDVGILNLNNSGIILNGGTYNIQSNASLNIVSSLTIDGSFTGIIDGDFNWNNTLVTTGNPSFDFTPGSIIKWNSGNLEGGGNLTNNNIIEKGTSSNGFIFGSSTLNNNGQINISSTNDIFIGTGSVINNNTSGIIELQSNFTGITASGAAPNTFNNSGILRGNVSSGSAVLNVQVNNDGIIEAVQNQLNFTGVLNNQSTGIIRGNGTITLPVNPANFINDGTLAPGASPGTLNLVNDFSSSASANLQVELDGNSQGVDYDLLAISGDANLNGNVEVILGHNPSINDEFIVLTTTGTINTCNLPLTAMASFGGFTYDFDVACRNNNEVVLTVTNQTLGIADFEEEQTFNLFPNPITDHFKINSNIQFNSIELYDMNGRMINEFDPNSDIFKISHLSQGVYVLRLKSIEGESFGKLLIRN